MFERVLPNSLECSLQDGVRLDAYRFIAERHHMFHFHHLDKRRVRLGPATASERRLTIGQSVFVIIGLSAFSWTVLIAIVLAARSVL